MEAQRNLQDYTEQRGSPRNLRQQLKDLKSVVGKQAKEIGSLESVTGSQAKEIVSLKSVAGSQAKEMVSLKASLRKISSKK